MLESSTASWSIGMWEDSRLELPDSVSTWGLVKASFR
jgi:hypothetical protein